MNAFSCFLRSLSCALLFVLFFHIENISAQVSITASHSASGTGSSVNSLTGVPAGALLVVSCQSDSHLSDATVTSSPALTWTKRADAEDTYSGDAEIWTAVYTAGGNITVTSDFGNGVHASVCYAMTNYDAAMGGNSAAATGHSAPSVNITTTRDNSIVIGSVSDWLAVDGSTRTYRNSATETFYHHAASAVTAYNFYKSAPATTSYTLGLSAPTGQSAGTALYEIRSAVSEPPSCISIADEHAATGSGSSVNTFTSVPAGALLVVACQAESHLSDATVSSSPSLTWTKRADAEDTYSGDVEIWTAVFTAGGSISVTSDFGNGAHSTVCYVITNYDAAMGGANAVATVQTAPSATITTTRANSLVIGSVCDWIAVDGTMRTYRDNATETFYHHAASSFTTYNFYKQAAGTGNYTLGLSAPGGQYAGIVLYEIQCPENPADTIAPDTPLVCFTGKTSTTLTIDEVTATTDNVGVTGYTIYIVGGDSVNVSDLPYTITGLTAGNEYSIYVKARDAAGNRSVASAIITRATLATNLLFDEGFENCNPWANWDTNQDAGHAWSRQQSNTHANEGNFSFRAEVRSGCDGAWSSGYRSEIEPKNIVDTGVMWYGFSIYLDEPYSGSNWTGSYGGSLIQWHPNNAGGAATMALIGSYGVWDLMTNHSGAYDEVHHLTSTNFTRGWHHIVFKVNWDSATGYVKVWIDGDLVYDLANGVASTWKPGGEILNWNPEGRYLKVGMNRWGPQTCFCGENAFAPCDTWILYYDNIRIGNAQATYEDVAPVTGSSFRISQPRSRAVELPAHYTLGQSYPNPASGPATIQYTLPQKEKVRLSLYDVSGRLVSVLVNGTKEAGTHTAYVNANSLSKGIYYYRIEAGRFNEVKKMTVQ